MAESHCDTFVKEVPNERSNLQQIVFKFFSGLNRKLSIEKFLENSSRSLFKLVSLNIDKSTITIALFGL